MLILLSARGLTPSPPLQVEEVLFHLIDLDTLLAPSGKEADASKKAQLRESLAAGPLLSWFAGLERFAGRNASGWLVGDSLTVADLALYSRVMSFKLGKCTCPLKVPASRLVCLSRSASADDNIPGNIVDGFPKVSALYERVLKHPKVAEWNAMPGH
jgi:glutathione S-transferase